MNLQTLEHPSSHASDTAPVHGRRQRHADDNLFLTELNPFTVLDQLDGEQAPVNLTSFGVVRETCPKCLQTHLHLLLRQRNVRTAHLFCADCHGCFDAHYASGAPALTI